MSDFYYGFCFSLSGFKLVFKPGIRIYLLTPLGINSILFSILIYFGSNEFSTLVDWIEQQWQWMAWIGWLLWPIFFVIMLTVVFFCFSVAVNLIAAPFNGLLSSAVERYLCNLSALTTSDSEDSEFTFGVILGSIFSEIRKFSYIMSRTIPLLILFIIPFAQVFAPIIWIFFAAWVMALEYLEYPLGNQGNNFQQVRQQVAIHRKLSMGFGLGISLLTIIPVVNFIVMPVAVAGATKLYLERLK